MNRLTKAEIEWLEKLQAVLDKCPSGRFGYYTIGDRTIYVYDNRKEREIDKIMNSGNYDFCQAVAKAKAELADIDFPANVASTAG